MESWKFRIKETIKITIIFTEWVISILKLSGHEFCVLLKWRSTRLKALWENLIFFFMLDIWDSSKLRP